MFGLVDNFICLFLHLSKKFSVISFNVMSSFEVKELTITLFIVEICHSVSLQNAQKITSILVNFMV